MPTKKQEPGKSAPIKNGATNGKPPPKGELGTRTPSGGGVIHPGRTGPRNENGNSASRSINSNGNSTARTSQPSTRSGNRTAANGGHNAGVWWRQDADIRDVAAAIHRAVDDVLFRPNAGDVPAHNQRADQRLYDPPARTTKAVGKTPAQKTPVKAPARTTAKKVNGR